MNFYIIFKKIVKTMIKDLYPVNKYPFEELLINNNYKLDEETYKKYIHPKYCIHISKKKEICRRKKVEGKEYCCNHISKDERLKNKCNYKIKNKYCLKTVKSNKLCHLHGPVFDEKTKDVYNYLLFDPKVCSKIYKQEIYNKNYYINIIEHKEYIYSKDRNNLKIIHYDYINFSQFINKIFNQYEKILINKYKINIYTLLSILNMILEINIPIDINDLYNIVFKNNMKIIVYNKFGYEAINKYTNDKIRKYIKNKKKKNKKTNKPPKIKISDTQINNIEIIEFNIKENESLFKNVIKFISLKIKDNGDIEKVNLIIKFIESIKYNKYFKFYCNFIKTNINMLLNLNNISTTVCLDDYKYKKVIIFNKNKDMNLKKILLDLEFEINDVPKKQISWFGNKNGLYDYINKYNIYIEKLGINIYKKEDTLKKHKLNKDQLIIFYC